MHWKRSEFESASDPHPLAEAMSRELGDSYVPPTGKNRIIIEFNYPKDEAPSVEVTFGPWPK